MNPVLIKPEADTRSQVVVLGEADRAISRLPWRERRARLWPSSATSLHALLDDYDVVVIEGAGSPAEINLRAGDIVNMARRARGRGARAAVLRHRPRRRVRAPAGHVALPLRRSAICSRASCSTASAATPSLLAPGPAWLEQRTGVPTLGVSRGSTPLPEEDGVALQGAGRRAACIAIVALPRIANLDEFAPLGAHARFVRAQPRSKRRSDRHPRHQEHARRPRLAAHHRPGRRDHTPRRGRRAGAGHLRRAADPRPERARSAGRRGRRRGDRASACSTS